MFVPAGVQSRRWVTRRRAGGTGSPVNGTYTVRASPALSSSVGAEDAAARRPDVSAPGSDDGAVCGNPQRVVQAIKRSGLLQMPSWATTRDRQDRPTHASQTGGGTEHAMANGRAETEAPRGAMNPEEATEILSSCERTHKTDHPAPSLDQNERSPRASGAASLVWSRQMPVRHGVAPKRERMSRFCRTRQLGQVALRRVVRPA